MIKIGMMIGDRYEILEKIGTGGMSDVYKAKCHKLNRYVAVKVLKQEFSENTNFVSKFRVEAQAAASLTHPNIVNVYDVGEENGIYYIVMELVEGITLKKYIEKKARLSVKEAVSIAIQACMGIEAAHKNHIIHRDIKPQNIIISKEGKVKVTDFGIAKAATSNTITSNVMGSVHYTSPEQARGGYSDEKSDIYSMGITLFEMLTGRVPFNGDTTVAIAIKQIQEEMPSPREFVPEIPVSVERIVLKCTQKSPDRRYQSMPELIEDLKKALMAPDEDFVQMMEPDDEAATRMIKEDEISEIKKQTRRREYTEEDMRLKKNPPRKRRPVAYEEIEEEEEEEEEVSKMEKLTTVFAVIGAVLIGCIVLFLVGRSVGIFGTESTPVHMIEVEGMDAQTAEKQLKDMGLEVVLEYETSDSVEEGKVISADVPKGTEIKEGDTVTLTISGEAPEGSTQSSDQSGLPVPDVKNKTEAEARATLTRSGFEVTVQQGESDTVPEGSVISQSPEGGSRAASGSTIVLVISSGPSSELVSVPDVRGQDIDTAVAILVERGLVQGTITYVNNEDPNLTDKVCEQSYSVGTIVAAGTKIDLSVSQGPKVTYALTGEIESPALENPDYKAGTPCQVVVTTASGKEIFSTMTETFPVKVNIGGIEDATGVITFGYSVTGETTTQVDPATGETISIPGESKLTSSQRVIEFTIEEEVQP